MTAILAVGSSAGLGGIGLWLLEAASCVMAFCALCAAIMLAAHLVDDIKSKYGSEKNNNVCQNLNLAGGFGLVSGQPNKKCRTLGERLGYACVWVLITVAGLAVYLGQELLWVAGRIKGSELVTLPVVPFSAALCDVFHKRVVMPPNASNSATGDRGASPAKADGKA